jgi:N-acetylglucosaminyldiphosphoundecaprenol N-acetyl-beta-D-mannosaminyltransferase
MNHALAEMHTRANIFGVGVHAIDMSAAIVRINEIVNSENKGYVCVTAVHGVIEAQHDRIFADALHGATLVTADGMPLVWLGKLQGHPEIDRVFGPDLMLAVCRAGVERATTHFLYGGKPGVAQQLKSELERIVPGVRIVGTYSPPFRELSSDEQVGLVQAVRKLKPDIIWVGVSTPKQEKFMARYLPLFDTHVMIGVGAAFDFHTGRIKDSPNWVKRSGLQWFHRLLQEPSRLWKRYLFCNSEFLLKAALQVVGITRYRLERSEALRPDDLYSADRSS